MSDKLKYRLVVLYSVISVGVVIFYAISWLHNPATVVPHGVSVADWLSKLGAGRNLALSFTTLLLIALRKREPLGYMLLTLGLMELYDSAAGLFVKVPASSIAPIINAFFYFVCAWYLLRTASGNKV
jgi:hypothetical protein